MRLEIEVEDWFGKELLRMHAEKAAFEPDAAKQIGKVLSNSMWASFAITLAGLPIESFVVIGYEGHKLEYERRELEKK